MIVEVWHAQSNPFVADATDHVHVANVEVADGLETVPALEEAYRLTNHIDCPWWENEGVMKVIDGNARSTSVGDRIKMNGQTWQVDMIDWKEVE